MVSASVSVAGRMVRSVSVMVAMVRPRRAADGGRRTARRGRSRSGPNGPGRAVATARAGVGRGSGRRQLPGGAPSPRRARASVRASRPSVDGLEQDDRAAPPRSVGSRPDPAARPEDGPRRRPARTPRRARAGAASSPAARSSSTVAQPTAARHGRSERGHPTSIMSGPGCPARARTRAARTGRWPAGCRRRRRGGPSRCRRRAPSARGRRRDQPPEAATARPGDGPDRGEVAQPVERGAAGDRGRLAPRRHEVVREARVGQRRHGLGHDARRGARRRPRTRRTAPPTMASAASLARAPRAAAGSAATDDARRPGVACDGGLRRSAPSARPSAGPRRRPRSRSPASRAARSAGSSCGGETQTCGWRASAGEGRAGLGQPPIEGGRLARPAQRLQAVPERLRVERVEEQERVAEVAQLAARDGMDLRLVERAGGGRVGGVDRGRASAGQVGALQDEGRGAGRQVDGRRRGQAGLGEPGQERSRVASAVPWNSSSSWTPAMSSPWRVRNSSGSGRQRPVEHEQPAARPQGGPRGPERCGASGSWWRAYWK